jgi:hypothetical protein
MVAALGRWSWSAGCWRACAQLVAMIGYKVANTGGLIVYVDPHRTTRNALKAGRPLRANDRETSES